MIYLHQPLTNKFQKKNISEVLNKNQISSVGRYTKKFEKKIINFTKSKFAVVCSSGTAALHIALKVIGVRENCEVIVPTITFIATVNAIKYNSADPVFMDNDEYFNIDQEKTLEFLNLRTFQKNGKCFNKKTKKQIKALIITHMYGNASSFLKIFRICKLKNIKIVEDAAESLGTFYKSDYFKKKHTGVIGDIGCFSFNGNKIITTGNGGALITNKKIYEKKIRYYINQSKENNYEYLHHEIGFNYRMTNLSAALGYGQIRSLRKILIKKKKIFDIYDGLLKKNNNFYINSTPSYSANNNWLVICRLKKKKYNSTIKKIVTYCKKKKIEIRPIWRPCHLQKFLRRYETYKIKKALELYNSSICLPSSYHLQKKTLIKIVNVLNLSI